MPLAVLDMKDRRPIWAMPSWVPGKISDALPTGWELQVLDVETDGSGDGAGRVGREVLDAVAGAEIYFGYGIAPELLRAGRGLKWVHSGAAGVGGSLTPEMRSSPVLFTNSAGIHAPPMAETVLGMILFFGRGLDFAVANMREARWDTAPYYVAGAPLHELSELTVGLVGFGGIGREIARRVCALGARIVALKRTPPRPGEGDLAPVSGGGSLDDRIELVHGEQGLDAVLTRSDVLVLCAPETEETRGILNAEAMRRMKRGALVINVGRGRLVELDALVEALRDGRLRGAGLDVFPEEPLPDDHPLWSLPNALITPHVSAVTGGFWRRETDLITENVRRYLAAQPLRNLVDKAAGY